MEIEEAFTTEAIDAAGTNVGGEMDDALKDVIERIYTSNELAPASEDDVKVAMLAFVAGRTYQADLEPGDLVERVRLVRDFLRFLAQEG